jgi:amino acid adenylation domain-containing protein
MDFPRDECLHSLFEAQAARTPMQAALVHDDAPLTYSELDRLANRLARKLRSLGVGPEVRVGLCAERSIEMAVGVLAVLKAGGAYVPLDARYPRERLEYMLRDSQAQVLLAHRALLPALPEHSSVVFLDGLRAETAGDSEAPVPAGATGGNLAYVIYTSGSTGRPKGVTLGHAALCNLMRWHLAQPALARPARTLQFASLSFDVSCQEMFSTWASGGTLVLISEDARRDSAELLRVLEAARVERLFLPFVALHHLAEQAVELGRAPSALREIVTAGEQLQMTRPLTWLFQQLPGCSLHNHYGPSESHVVTAYTLEGPVESWPALPPIGRPIANSQAYVLDERLGRVSVGTVGELYLGGVCLARGYWNRPELTAERFIPDPFAREPGARLYRTGDLARYLPDGNIEFLGRADHQVKIRGFRIELGEVEVALRQHPEVREAVVVAREDSPGVKRLVAYVTGEKGAKPGPEVLRTHLKQRLPEYMVPSAVVVLEALPLSPNGKVERKALPEPGPVEREGGVAAPRTVVEQVVASVYGQVLGVEEVGREEHFFELGGHSLLATQVVSRVRRLLGVEVKLSALFTEPTVEGFAREVERARRVEGEEELKALGSGAREGELSFAQQRLWFLQKLEPGNPFYNIPCVLVLEGKVEERELERALVAVVQRHEALRTRFGEVEGRAFQQVEEQGRVKLEVEEWEGRPWAEVEERARQEARKPFELSEGPLVRGVLLRVGEEKRVLVLTVHHIVADGWSLEVVLKELGQLYAAYERGEEAELAQLPVQYVDYAQWQRKWLKGRVQEEQLSYWRKQLSGVAGALELPTDKPRPAVRRYRGARHEVELPGEVVKGVREVARREGVTPFMVLVGALQVLLQRYTGQEDVVVGTPVANRGRVEVEGVVGFFANTLALRTRLEGEPSFREVLGRVRETALGAYGHQDVPFEKLVEELQPTRDLSRTPLFQVMLAVQDAAVWRLQLPGVQVRPVEVDPGISKFDLTLFLLEEEGGGLRGFWEYDTDLFEAGTVRRLARHYERVLGEACARPEEKVWRLALLEPEERRQLVEGWNETRVERPEGCIHRLFEEQAQSTPEAIALSYEQQHLTYGQLNGRANQVAHRLREMGVGPDVLVGVCLERSVEMVVGLLGVLKAGGAYLPLDPGYPAERLQFMLEDARTPVLLTQKHLAERLSFSGTQVLVLDAPGVLEGWPESNPPLTVSGGNLAYVIYTSGSTGRPKGACVPHRGIWNRLLWMQEAYRLTAEDRILQKTPFGFDVSVWEFFWPLMYGARLVMARPGGHQDAAYLIDCIIREGITTLHFVPSMLEVFLEQPGVERCHSIRRVICSGEALPAELQRRFFSRLGAELHNLYGPTEASVDVSYWACSRTDSRNLVPIGWPIHNIRLHVLDAHLQPVPMGVVGELYIGGVGLARGYWNRPELTAERFIPDPFGTEPGGRLYRTGDLARYLPDASIDFLGRADHQVKIRGFRIELGEVEVALRQHPEVREAVVVAREDSPGVKRLVAYVTGEKGAKPSVEALRTHLKQRLPEHMVPSVMLVLEALPLSPNGKVDRKSLPAPGLVTAEPSRDTAPLSPVEELLAGIWRQVLNLPRVGREDDFFVLGGDSILSLRIVARANTAGLAINVKQLFQNPTIAGLAAQVAVKPSGPSGVEGPQPLPMAGLNDKNVRAVLSRFRARDGEGK